MKISQAYEAVKSLQISMKEIFEYSEIDYPFVSRLAMGAKIEDSLRGILISGDGIGSKSGIYLIATPEDDILYIGKATKNNLHHRVWGHLKTPQELDVVIQT